MRGTSQVVKTRYNHKPERVGNALVEIIENADNQDWMTSGPHAELVSTITECQHPTGESSMCVLDVVERVIAVFMNDSKALSAISEHLRAASMDSDNEDLKLAQAYIHEVYLSARGLEVNSDRQKEILAQIKLDILRQRELTGKNRHMIHALKSSLEFNQALDEEQSELLRTLEAQLVEKAELDNEQSELISQIKKAFVEKTLVDLEQSEILQRLEAVLGKKEEIDQRQTKSLLKIKEELISKSIKDIEQSSAIDRLDSRLHDLQAEIESLNRKFRDAGQGALERDRSVLLKLNKMGVLVSVILIYMVILSIGLFLR